MIRHQLLISWEVLDSLAGLRNRSSLNERLSLKPCFSYPIPTPILSTMPAPQETMDMILEEPRSSASPHSFNALSFEHGFESTENINDPFSSGRLFACPYAKRTRQNLACSRVGWRSIHRLRCVVPHLSDTNILHYSDTKLTNDIDNTSTTAMYCQSSAPVACRRSSPSACSRLTGMQYQL